MMKSAPIIATLLILLGCQKAESLEKFQSERAVIMHSESSQSYIIVNQNSFLIAALPSGSSEQFEKLESQQALGECILTPFFAKVEGVYLDKARARIDELSVLGRASRSSIEGSDFTFRRDYICDSAT
ncbi:MAG: hypothetical protein ABJM58_05440 [Alteripontixanthobacter sp.]